MSGTVAGIVFVVGLVASIMVHEWGHFATARRFGMRAEQFFLGFGPTLWSTRRGETEFGVKALPLGGFVRIKGMSDLDERLPPVPVALATRIGEGEEPVDALRDLLDERGARRSLIDRLTERYERTLSSESATHDDPAVVALELIGSEVPATGRPGDLHHRLLKGDEGRFFTDKPAWQRAIVLGSGSALHWLQAIVLIFLGWLVVGPEVIIPVVGEYADARLEDGTVIDSAAEEAGLLVGDRLLAVNGVVSDDFQELRRVIRDAPGQPIPVLVEREGQADPVELTVTPSPYLDPDVNEIVGLIGFFPATENQPMDADEALYATFVGPGSFPSLFKGTIGQLGNVFGLSGISTMMGQLSGEEERGVDGGISLIGAVDATAQGTEAFGPLFLFSMLAMVNVFVGIFNALPLPPLDGGQLAVLGIESSVNAYRRRVGRGDEVFTIDPRAIASVAIPVIVFVGLVSVGLVVLDLTDPINLSG